VITLFLCGDVMTGRGIDQVLPHPNPPRLFEPYVTSARQYVELAEQANGPIRKPVNFPYIYGEALAELDRVRPDLRVVNLETAVTTSEDCQLKGINYRMHPKNIPCITAAGIDCCVLGNNHVLDWGHAGLLETLASLETEGIKTAGAGRDIKQAEAPAILEVPDKCRVIVLSFGDVSSGIPRNWAASADRPGVNLLPDLSERTAARIAGQVKGVKRLGDVAVASIHWGENWGYDIPRRQRTFAQTLIDLADIDIVHGHSSHHPKGIEIYKEKPILYGCGDFLNDYEGIEAYEGFRDDLVLMYFPSFEQESGRLVEMTMTPLQIRNFRLNRPTQRDFAWLYKVLDRECRKLGARVDAVNESRLALRWGNA
jgi:poly-gamma-glutamate synthesis protein (capsule biosynthesis protein)